MRKERCREGGAEEGKGQKHSQDKRQAGKYVGEDPGGRTLKEVGEDPGGRTP